VVRTRFIPWESIAFRSLFGEMLHGLRLWPTASRQMEITPFARLDEIALDDYAGGRKLWPNEKALAGCSRALSRPQRKGVPLAARPLGEVPQPNKYGVRVTSLALIGRTS